MNIIVLTSDTFRYDNLFEFAAKMPVRTPSLDAFAGRAASMTRFYTGGFPTIPHRTARLQDGGVVVASASGRAADQRCVCKR